MNDDPNATGAQGTGSPDPLDDTQRVEVPSYAPTPEPRPDARWAWAQPAEAGTPASHWYASPGGQPGGTGYDGSGQPATGSTPALAAVAAPSVRGRARGTGTGTIVAVSLLSAALASGGTVLVLDRNGAFDRQVASSSTGSATPAGNQAVTIDESSAVIDAAAKVSPAVVKITTEAKATNPFGSGETEGVGSGVIYDPNGWILTNKHVVADATTLTIELKDGRQFDGRVYGTDTLTDLAIVKVDQTGLPTAPIGHSDGLKVGQLVIAIGSPLGTYSFSVTSGIVSGKGRDVNVNNDSGQPSTIVNLIQTDAAINPGNSGGPLVDASGAVVGINTAVATDSNGIGFAIPIDMARPIMDQAVHGEALSRPWIGIRFQSIDYQLKKDRNLSVDEGALVTTNGGSDPAVTPDSPAEKAGLKDGDVILSINGMKVDQEHPLNALIVQFSPGDAVTLDILRDGKSITVTLTLGTRPDKL
jgi:S1-C subfamily serine protease